MRTIAVTNQKGGVGKTTTALHLAVGLARRDQRVLAVDLDPQGHLTIASACTPPPAVSLYEVMTDAANLSDILTSSPHGIALAPADQFLARIETDGTNGAHWQHQLSHALESVSDQFDWCVIDTPPSLGVLSINALVAANHGALVPLVPELFPLKGMQLLLRTMTELGSTNRSLRPYAVVPTMARARWASHRNIIASLPELLDGIPVAPAIPSHGGFARAAAQRSTIFKSAPHSSGATAYHALAEMVLNG